MAKQMSDGIGNRVAIYARVSTEEQAEHGYSIDGQKETIKQYCQLYKKTVVGEYVDAGISGKEMSKRLQLQKLLHDAEAGKFDEVVVWKINRMSRNTKDLLEIVDKLEKHDVHFSSISERFDTNTPMGKFGLQLMAAVGELERNTIVENVRMGLKQRAKQGWHNGSRALGYVNVPSKTRPGKNDLVIDEAEAAIIREIFDLYCSGRGFRSIANQLNKEGYKTVKGKDFSLCGIREIIDNPIYKGFVRYARYENWSEKRRRGKNPEPIIRKGTFEPIVSEEQWDKAAGMRKLTAKVTTKVYGNDNYLSCILRCPECGAPMVISRSITKLKDGTKRTYRFYSCSEFKNKGSTVCHSNAVSADYAEEYVIERLREVLGHPKLLHSIIAKVKEKAANAPKTLAKQISKINAQLDTLTERRDRIVDLYSYGQIDKEMLDDRLKELTKQTNQLVDEKEALTAKSDVQAEDVNDDYIKEIVKHLEKVMASSDGERKHNLMRLLIDRITVKDHKIDKIFLRLGDEIQTYMESNVSPSTEMVGGLFLCPSESKDRKLVVDI